MQNEPNSLSSIENRESRIENMQNKPNSTNAAYKLKGPPKVAQLNYQSSIINYQWKDEPNFTPNFSSTQEFTRRKTHAFTKKCKKMRAIRTFLTLTHLTLCTTKTYINFFTEIPFTLKDIRDSFIAFQNKVDFINNCKIIQKYAFGLTNDKYLWLKS